MNVAAKQIDSEKRSSADSHNQDCTGQIATAPSLETLYSEFLELKLSEKSKPEHLIALIEFRGETESDGSIFLALAQWCVTHADWDTAYLFAAKSLITRPKSLAAMNVLRKYYLHVKNEDALAKCLQNRLPEDIKLNFMEPFVTTWTESSESEGATAIRLPSFPSKPVALKTPRSMTPVSDPSYQHSSTSPVEAYAVLVSGGRLWYDGYNIVVWDSSGRLIRDLCTGYPEVIAYKAQNIEPIRLEGKICLLGNRGATNYYHWMNDVLPRLGILEQNGIGINSVDKFVASGLKSSFHSQTLAHLGIQPSQIHRIANGRYIQADELILANFGSHDRVNASSIKNTQSLHLSQSPWSSDYLRQIFLPPAPQPQQLKLYITRGATGTRALTNEAEVVDFLTGRGFQCINPINYSVTQQAELFSRSAVVIGVHGAGLSNIVFCQPGTKVIELYGLYTAECFWIISAFSGLEHYVMENTGRNVKTDTVEGQTPVNNRQQARNASLHICTTKLSEMLDYANID